MVEAHGAHYCGRSGKSVMNAAYENFLAFPTAERQKAFGEAAARLGTIASYMEKDFWVCLVLDALYHHLPAGHPRLLFRGGTSLSKAFGLIRRFSEDVDLTVYRGDLGFADQRDPTVADISNTKRKTLFEELRAACSAYVLGELKDALTACLDEIAPGCQIATDKYDATEQTLLVRYPSLYPEQEDDYVLPQVKLEGGARSALTPSRSCSIAPYIADDLPEHELQVDGIDTIIPERTFLDKLLVLHGLHCGYREADRLPKANSRISRHYYDFAVISGTETGTAALADRDLLDDVRDHSMVAFRQAWKRLDEAVPGTVRLEPQPELRAVLEQDYATMQGMMLGDAPDFGWIVEQVRRAEAAINDSGPGAAV